MLRVFLSIMTDAAYPKADPAAARELLTFARRTLRSMFDRMVPPAQANNAAPSDACAVSLPTQMSSLSDASAGMTSSQLASDSVLCNPSCCTLTSYLALQARRCK